MMCQYAWQCSISSALREKVQSYVRFLRSALPRPSCCYSSPRACQEQRLDNNGALLQASGVQLLLDHIDAKGAGGDDHRCFQDVTRFYSIKRTRGESITAFVQRFQVAVHTLPFMSTAMCPGAW